MKRNPKPFSVEIKKTRVQGQPSGLPPRRLFATTLAEATKIFQKEEPRAMAAPSAAPRILPSIIESMWSSSEPVESVRRKHSSMEGNREQIEFDLTATASEDAEDTHAGERATARAVPRTDGALADAEDATPVHDVQPAQGEGVKAKSRKPRNKTSGAVEQEIASGSTPEAQMAASSVASSKAVQRRLTKRLAAAAQLPRHERWKGRLHPAAW
jgi:hypothetical protein